jgi:hypothetical protein
MLDEFYRDNETNLFAISTLFAVLAYGKDFAKKFIEFASAEGNGLKASLSRSQEYLSVQQNFSQNYLNTCTAVSAFAVLSDAFCGNVEVLKFALEYEVSKLEKEVPNGTDPAFKSHSWRDAPTVNEERIRRIELCKSTLDAIENGTPPKTIEEQRNELLHVMEMVSALQDDTPTLLSTRVLNGISKRLCGKCEFIISCALSIVGNFLAKIVSFGAYVGSLNFKERFAGVRPPKINFLSFVGNSKHVIDFESRNLPGLWAEIFPCGTTVEWRSNNHCIAVKAAKDEHGKYLVVYDPIQGTSEIIRVP